MPIALAKDPVSWAHEQDAHRDSVTAETAASAAADALSLIHI